MKNKIKQTALLVLSCASLVATIGYSSWIVQSHQEYALKNLDNTSKPVAYIVGNDKVKYTSIEKALDVAKSGDIVCVIPPESGCVNYTISRNCTVPAGVTLVFPTSKSSFSNVKDSKTLSNYITGMIEVPDGPGNNNVANESNKKICVKVNPGVKITNKGSIVISGKLTGGNNGAGKIGQTSGDYCELLLDNGAMLEQSGSDSSNLYCFGFINETNTDNGSVIDIQSGSIYMPFVVDDYRGFSYSYALSKGGGVSDKGCSAFNRYEFPNVSSLLKISSSGCAKAIVNILVDFSQMKVNNQVSHETLSMVGFDKSFLIWLNTGASFEYKFDSKTRKASITILDGCTLGNLAFKASVGDFSADMNTSTAFFPVPYNFSIKLQSSSSVSKAKYNCEKQAIKFLPGAYFEIGENCDLACGSIAVYSAFVDGNNGDGKLYKHTANSMHYPLKPGAQMIVKGNSVVSAKSIGGTIYCDETQNIQSSSENTLCNEPWSIGGGLVPSFTEYLEIRERMNVVPRSFLNKKKIYFYSNVFASSDTYLPKTKVLINGNDSDEIIGVQKVLFADTLSTCKMEFEENIFKALYNLGVSDFDFKQYAYEEVVSGLQDECLFGVTNSTLSISSSNNGVNEFVVQSISISSSQDKIDGKDPLYVGKDLGLKANIVDSSKVYNPTITWSSSNPEVATVDEKGVVHGKKLGRVVIYAECSGRKASYKTEVIPEQEMVEITNMWLQSSNGKKSNDLKGNSNTIGTANDGSKDFAYNEKVTKNCTIKISLKVEPSEGQITGIIWKFKAWGGQSYMKDPNDNQKQIRDLSTALGGENDSSIKEIEIVFDTPSDTGTGKSPDSDTLWCTAYYQSGKKFEMSFVFDHDHLKMPCIVYGTLVTLKNGSRKRVEDLTENDEVVCFNHELGVLTSEKLFYNYHSNEYNWVTAPILDVSFSNGTSIGIHVDHGFFDLTLGKYVYINKDNYLGFIGHDFVTVDCGKLGKARLVSGNVSVRTVRVYSPVSVYHLNVITNGLLSITGEIEGWFNYFDYDFSLAYEKNKKQADIEKYGLYTYDEFKDYIRKEIFDLLPIPYLKISVGKGLTTKEKIIEVMKKYLSFM